MIDRIVTRLLSLDVRVSACLSPSHMGPRGPALEIGLGFNFQRSNVCINIFFPVAIDIAVVSQAQRLSGRTLRLRINSDVYAIF